jgi:hypothetical protein
MYHPLHHSDALHFTLTVYDFHVILTINIISLNSINWLVLVMEMYCVIYIILQPLQLMP